MIHVQSAFEALCVKMRYTNRRILYAVSEVHEITHKTVAYGIAVGLNPNKFVRIAQRKFGIEERTYCRLCHLPAERKVELKTSYLQINGDNVNVSTKT